MIFIWFVHLHKLPQLLGFLLNMSAPIVTNPNLLPLANTWSQNQTFSGTNNTAPSQTLTGSSSILTQGLGDSRYGAFYSLIQPTDLSAASTAAVTSSTQLTLPSGSYQFWGNIWCTCVSTTAGINGNLALVSGSNPVAGINGGYVLQAASNSNAFDSNTGGIGTTGNVSPANAMQFQFLLGLYSNATGSGSHCQGQSSGWFQITGSAILAFQVSQRNATDGSNPALLRANSAFFFRKFA